MFFRVVLFLKHLLVRYCSCLTLQVSWTTETNKIKNKYYLIYNNSFQTDKSTSVRNHTILNVTGV